ncbi:hypothetical protein DSM03_108123 [Leeuwenhoekiella aestuarii]|uniref:DUF4397 domain-containing protein n=1 Tax=Leeuwenhoekiella aestuarii TaxID=2249426 RepID=A0A4Q0NQV1_9FLAO|nr:DUF4397 domain-containing protein [Leeuwenhoekiella aestuarii]RXG12977.1 hypothetical protein DSM03_108123 [Leeuwenhoekiella aestuarii]RXG13043.1 hypothetical protein DSM04_10520 [Leeuwenhoekiella aestuarii]
MRAIKYLIPVFLLYFISCSEKGDQYVELRLGDFLVENSAVSMKLISDGATEKYSLNYSDLTSYYKIKPGVYQIQVVVHEKVILEKKIGFAAGGKFTLFIYGLLSENQVVNQTTTSSQLHSIVSGAEARTANGYLPQMRLLDDHYEGGKTTAQMRWVNLVPFEKSFTAEASLDSDINFGTTAYGNDHASQKFDIGTYSVIWRSKSSPIKRLEMSQALDKQTLYTFFLIPEIQAKTGDLKVVTGESSKTNKE